MRLTNIRGAYIHFPFCVRKCVYCDFAILAQGKRSIDDPHSVEIRKIYSDFLVREIKATYSFFECGDFLRSVYFGGGTPSLATYEQLKDVYSEINKHQEVEKEAEVTLEVNPDGFTWEKGQEWSEMGINRVSIGIQSLNQHSLTFLKRTHTVDSTIEALDKAISIFGRNSISADVLIAIPGEDLSDLSKTLQVLEGKKLGHLSCYVLMVEEGTKLYQLQMQNKVSVKDEEQKYEHCRRTLSENYFQYEVSSFVHKDALEKKAVHNSMYWRPEEDFFGFGMGAASLINGKRFVRPKSLKAYYKFVEELEADPSLLLELGVNERESAVVAIQYQLMGKLRRREGIQLSDVLKVLDSLNLNSPVIEKTISVVFEEAASKLPGIFDISQKENRILVVKPENFIILNSILSEIFIDIQKTIK